MAPSLQIQRTRSVRKLMRIKTQTPFPVKYRRLSQTRGRAPTLVPHPEGAPVSGEILVLDDSVSSNEARGMLWGRERRKMGNGEQRFGANIHRSSGRSVRPTTLIFIRKLTTL